jgi:NAD(P)-dependent dehydrogenase (short-subunit alcohol dehydrogenase family)
VANTDSVVVLGSAGGIGAATVMAFLDREACVVGVDRLPLTAAAAAHLQDGAHPAAASPHYHHLVADVTDPAALAGAFAQAAALRPIGHVVAVAGGAHPDEVETTDLVEVPAAALAESVLLNLTSGMFIAQAALPHLRRTGQGASLTFTGSINGVAGIGLHAYSAAKAGLLSLARTLAAVEGPRGVRVNVVLPGTVVTPRTRQEHAGQAGHFAAMRESTALGRTAEPAEVAAAFVALALDLTAMTGQSLIVDAGQIARWR